MSGVCMDVWNLDQVQMNSLQNVLLGFENKSNLIQCEENKKAS